ncbi:helix-turn-helix domain-containing protein [Streptomyces sp. XM4193]|uniref:helix-turn-helix domain-containing protein n=1 Tax=Streptomyces sp. XM4193 TaxID=2929782 RepID=UPI001FF7F9F7|nr:helix-turn-helix domain-containing protein [Streptomyces sp. XM4193]MCK1796249.1 helix-turn-helix domain-containing protein [Streptomyces sp. XM4193]
MTSGSGDVKELGTFLKTRRAELSPAGVGLPDLGTPRRVQGLRREEVAQLASISTDYYTRIEQGRIDASMPVLESVSRALRLSPDQRTYLFHLAGKPAQTRLAHSARTVSSHTRRLLDTLGDSPALVLSTTMDVLAWNRLASALFLDFGKLPEEDLNYVWLLFDRPEMRDLYADWASGARACVAYLRMHTAGRPETPELGRLIAKMAPYEEFTRWWEGHEVAVQGTGSKEFVHSAAGTLDLDWDTLTSSTDSDQFIVVWTAPPGSPSQEGLRRLAAHAEAIGATAGEAVARETAGRA